MPFELFTDVASRRKSQLSLVEVVAVTLVPSENALSYTAPVANSALNKLVPPTLIAYIEEAVRLTKPWTLRTKFTGEAAWEY